MQPLHDLPIGLLQKFSNQQDNRRSSITGNIILCCRSPGDHNLCHVSKRWGIDLEQGDSLRLSDFGFAVKVSILAKYLRGGKAHHFPKQHISILGQFDLFLYLPSEIIFCISRKKVQSHTPPAPSTSLTFC